MSDLPARPNGSDSQGPAAVRQAAQEAVMRFLQSFPATVGRDDLWGFAPLLTEREAQIAIAIAAVTVRRFADDYAGHVIPGKPAMRVVPSDPAPVAPSGPERPRVA